MKGDRDKENTMGPMFPRLHINDASKGGPRAPPRNKMALYEQLTIPSNRLSPGIRHLNATSSSNAVPSPLTSQGTSHERSSFSLSRHPPAAPSYPVDRRPPSNPDAVSSRPSAPQAEQRQKPECDSDFIVPIFSQQETEQCKGSNPDVSQALPRDCDEGMNLSEQGGRTSRQNVFEQVKTLEAGSSSDHTVKNTFAITTGEDSNRSFEAHATNQAHQNENVLSRHVHNNEGTSGAHVGNCSSCELPKKLEGRVPLGLKRAFGAEESDSNNHKTDSFNLNEKKQFAVPDEHSNRGQGSSDTTIVDTLMGFDTSPDDIVGIIGLKHFWQARSAIASQQRVFAVQIFELHRLIKVQRLIAESPEMFSAFISKPSLEVSTDPHLKKLHTQLASKPVADLTLTKHKEASANSNQNNIQCSKENLVERKASPPVPLPQTISSQPFTNQASLAAPVPCPPLRPPGSASDTTLAPSYWPYPQPAGQQWLLPVMSPSEGLVYKPYPAHGFPGPFCGNYGGPFGPSPLMAHPFMHQASGAVAPPNHHQGMGTPPPHGVLPYSNPGYFPPFEIPLMSTVLAGSSSAVNQMNYQFFGSNLNGDAGQAIKGAPINAGTQQGSCNGASRRTSEAIGSTASSPSEKVNQGGAIGCARPVEARVSGGGENAVRPFPTTSRVIGRSEGDRALEETSQGTQVIKVVPRHARSASESAARIFRSIQEERRQQESS